MASELLKKVRRINKILQKTGAEPVVFEDICGSLSEILECNVYLINKKGKILGYRFYNGLECESIKEKVLNEKKFPDNFNNKLLSMDETVSNIENDGKSSFDDTKPAEIEGKLSTIVPIVGNRERLGTLFLTRFDEKFTDEDLVLAEYSATIVGLEILRSKNDELEEEARRKAVVQLAIGTLSYSELEAVEHVFNELDGNEGLLVASKIADKVGITRSVIVNALRKFESAGVIESRSLGMKGTHIKILNEKLIDELKKIK
ncbi:GTP-sensing transcriptional pleiotropic repressor CodY [Clostridium homopropionicum DSM 5847]|uniref:Global transcriptional regulator CodY n=1 Tax=Clostridium homopropionicum DSM 5847 TaxID=1121318 RepID=A0A0L6ZD08_9CLOT|nr:GTP-sensing pleiotropic transcriptional regulator CodY [Clostridium homopropionicum]KOA20861.1 GTP-sensing transcriptional pleiotropic repressor CodY [Clostridium homopropionicum DSM 5847]SFG03452.1 transcriptional pleiotropic repressor [Clostridium homopropionicum]